MKRKMFILAFTTAATLWSCAKKKSEVNIPKDAQVKLITAYFSAPFSGKAETDGLWVADRADFAKMIEKKYLAQHKPAPGEISASDIRKNIKDSRYFLRLDGVECDELFLVVGGQATAHPGQRMANPARKDSFRVIFVSRDPKDGKIVKTAAELHYKRGEDYMLLDAGGQPFRLYREKTAKVNLIAEYAKPALATELPQY